MRLFRWIVFSLGLALVVASMIGIIMDPWYWYQGPYYLFAGLVVMAVGYFGLRPRE